MSDDALHRRDFGRQLLGGLGAASLSGNVSGAADQPPPPALPEDAEPERPKLPSVEFLLLTMLVQRYPSEHYADEALQGIFGDIAGDVSRGMALRSFPLQNGDEPACCFRVFRAAKGAT